MRNLLRKILVQIIPQLKMLFDENYDFSKLRSWKNNSSFGNNVKISPVSLISDSSIDDWSYVNENAIIFNTSIGKFCSIGPNFFCGWGEHPTNGLSTHPAFYSTHYSTSCCTHNKVIEHRRITIGNDVYIGANVTVLDGVSIGDGAIIGAGAVVSKDIPPFAIAVGCPIQVKRYRFSQEQIDALLRIKWWEFKKEKLQDVEKMFMDINSFIRKYDQNGL